LLLVCSGLYSWWPKRPSKAAFKTAAVFNPLCGGEHETPRLLAAIGLMFVQVATAKPEWPTITDWHWRGGAGWRL